MPRRKVVRTVEEEEEFQRIKRERQAKWQAEKREKKQMIINKNCQSLLNTNEIHPNLLQPSTSFSKNIVIDSHVSINSSMKIVYPTSETVTIASQTIDASTTNIPIIKSSNEITAKNSSMKLFNIDDTIMKILPNNNIISPVSSTSNKLINLDNDNRLEDLIILHESQNTVKSDNTFKKSNLTFSKNNLNNKSKVANYIEKTRVLKKGYTEINTSHITQLRNVVEHYIGEMNVCCEHCDAKHFKSEKVANKRNSFNDCCSHGSVQLNSLPHPPDELYKLFIGNHPKSNHFLNRIRGYNNAFSFASFNASISNFGAQRCGPYCFKIQGQIYYQINTALYPASNEMPSYGQLFIVDNNEATECRLHRNSNLDEEILRSIDNIMRTNNIFAQYSLN